jgi:hypothetical protein
LAAAVCPLTLPSLGWSRFLSQSLSRGWLFINRREFPNRQHDDSSGSKVNPAPADCIARSDEAAQGDRSGACWSTPASLAGHSLRDHTMCFSGDLTNVFRRRTYHGSPSRRPLSGNLPEREAPGTSARCGDGGTSAAGFDRQAATTFAGRYGTIV